MRKRPLLFSGLLAGIAGLIGIGLIPAVAQERFTDNNDGTVTDSRSGLMWAQTDNQTDIYWKDARRWIKSDLSDFVSPQYDDWRLPTVAELEELYLDSPDYAGYQTACGHAVKMIPQIQLSCVLVWTSNSALGLPLAFNFNLGSAFTMDTHGKTGCRVLAVRNLE